MAAVSTLIDRIYRDFLNKPDDLSAFSRLDGAINDSVTSLNYEAGLFSVEEENLLGSGALIEIGQEIMLVTSATTSTRTLTVSRGYSGTTAAAHSDKDNIFVNPTIKEDTPKTTEKEENITDIVKSQMGKFGLPSTALTPPSEEQRNREKQALILSTLAKNIGSATNLSGIGEGFADATALAIGKSAADRKEDAEFLKSKRADVVSEIQIISSLQDIGARIRSNDIKERQIAQENAKLLLELLQDPTISLDPEKTKLYLGQLESYLKSGNAMAMASPSTGVGGVNFTK